MSLGQVLGDVMKESGLTASELGIPYSESMMRKVRTGERKIARDIAPIATSSVDRPRVYLEAMREFTNGVGPLFLDGDNIDRHRAVMKERLLREMREGTESSLQFDTSKPPGLETDREKRARRAHMQEIMDVITFAYMYLVVLCDEYGDSFKALHDEHHSRLKSMRLVQ